MSGRKRFVTARIERGEGSDVAISPPVPPDIEVTVVLTRRGKSAIIRGWLTEVVAVSPSHTSEFHVVSPVIDRRTAKQIRRIVGFEKRDVT